MDNSHVHLRNTIYRRVWLPRAYSSIAGARARVMCGGVHERGCLLLVLLTLGVVGQPGACTPTPTTSPTSTTTTYTSRPHSPTTHAEETVREVLAGRQVYSYRSYKDVQIFHFSVPPHVSLSVYNFTANDSLACEPRNITIFLQAHSYPVINPDGAMYPPGLWVNRTRMYEVHLRSDLKPALLSVHYPVAGDWFMVAFIDEASNRITQAGLFPSCHSWLQATATHQQQGNVTTVVPEIHSYQDIQLLQNIKDLQYYRFYVPSSTWVVVVTINNCTEVGNENVSCPIDVAFRARALPDAKSIDTESHTCINGTTEDTCIAEFVPEEEAWHYLQLTTPNNTEVQFSMTVKLHCCDEVHGSKHLLSKVNLDNGFPEESNALLDNTTFTSFNNDTELTNASIFQEDSEQSGHIILVPATKTNQNSTGNCWPRHNLVKKTFGGNFVFEYDLPPNENGSVPLLLDITNASPTILTFNLESITDIGGTLVVELAISPFMNSNITHNISVSGCITLDVREEPDANGGCTRGHQIFVNTSSHFTKGMSVSIPFPEPGLWHLTLKPWCYLLNASSRTRWSR